MPNVHGGGKTSHATEAVREGSHHMRPVLCQGRAGEAGGGEGEEPVRSLQGANHWKANCSGDFPWPQLNIIYSTLPTYFSCEIALQTIYNSEANTVYVELVKSKHQESLLRALCQSRPLVRQRKDFVPAFGGFPPLPPMEWSASIVIVKIVKGS